MAVLKRVLICGNCHGVTEMSTRFLVVAASRALTMSVYRLDNLRLARVSRVEVVDLGFY